MSTGSSTPISPSNRPVSCRVVSDVFMSVDSPSTEIVSKINELLSPTKMRIVVEVAANGDLHFMLMKPYSKRKKYGLPDEEGVIKQNPRTLTKDLIADAFGAIGLPVEPSDKKK